MGELGLEALVAEPVAQALGDPDHVPPLRLREAGVHGRSRRVREAEDPRRRASERIGGKLRVGVRCASWPELANLFTGKERGKAIGVWAALAAVGIGLGPLTGGLLLEWFDWSSIFMVNVPFAAIALLLGIRYVPESRDPRPGRFDLLGAGLSTAGFSILVYSIIEAPEQGWTSGLVLGSLTASVALLAAFVWWERRTPVPMLDMGFFKSRRFSAAASPKGGAAGGIEKSLDGRLRVRGVAGGPPRSRRHPLR